MKTSRLILSAIAALLSPLTPLALAQQEDNAPPPAEAPASDPTSIPQLVNDLGNDKYSTRKAAFTALWKIGSPALPELKKIASSDDPEILVRSRELILYISSGVLPNTPDDVRELVIGYTKGNAEEKLAAIKKLIALKQWKQVIHLSRIEKNDTIRKSYESSLREASLSAVRNSLTRGKTDDALALLEFLGNSTHVLNMRAWIHVNQGTAAKELEKAAKLPGKSGILWRLALHRASGNYPAAIRQAKSAGMDDVADALRLLTGDPIPWLKRASQNKRVDIIHSIGLKLQLARLGNKTKTARQLAIDLTRHARGRESSARVCNILALNGYRNLALPILTKSSPSSAAEYFDSIEDTTQFFKSLGIPADAKAPYTEWAKKQAKLAVDEDGQALSRIIALAGFLRQHGETDHATAVIDFLMQGLEKSGADQWFNMLPSLGQLQLGEYALHIIKQRGNEDGETETAFQHLFIDPRRFSKDQALNIWQSLKLKNKQDLTLSMREMALLAGMLPDPDKKADALHKTLLLEVAQKAAAAKDERHLALYSLCRLRNDMVEATRLANTLAKNSARWKPVALSYNILLSDWPAAKPQLVKAAEADNASYNDHMQLYLCLKKTGEPDKANAALQRALLLTLGDTSALYRVGRNLTQAGEIQKAIDIWTAALATAGPKTASLDVITASISEQSGTLFRNRHWKLASSINEALILISSRGSSESFSYFDNHLLTYFRSQIGRSMHLMENGQRALAIRQLDQLHTAIPGDGILADDFFPIVRRAKLGKQYDVWFQKSYQRLATVCQKYPRAHNAHNSAAWLSARAARNLDAALKHSETSLKHMPHQAAYIDTMAEVWFAKGDRAKAIQWGNKATAAASQQPQGFLRSDVNNIANYLLLKGQLLHFKNDKLGE